MKQTNLYLLVAVAVGLSACKPTKTTTPPPPKVTVSQPQMATVTNWDQYPGHLEAVEMVEVRPRVPGYLDSIDFVDGQEVKAGQLLFQIDPKPYQAELDHAEALRVQAETRLGLGNNDLHRAEALRGTRAISEEEYDSRSNAAREAEAALTAARAAEAAARLNLNYTHITAPITGKIGRRLMTMGNLVQLQGNGGATVLATIVSMDPIYCYFDVEEGAFLKYSSQAKAADKESGLPGLACELGLVNEAGFGHRGQLDFFDNQVNPQTGTIRLRAVFSNPNHALVPGMFANVRIPAGPPERTVLVPDVAVQSDQGYKFVYIANSENKVETRSIQTGPAHGSLRSVFKGLSPQDRVIVNGLMLLRPDIKVDVQETSPPKVQNPLAQDSSQNARP
jgi:RND family efflux transporter MFP subunit